MVSNRPLALVRKNNGEQKKESNIYELPYYCNGEY